MTDDEIKRMTLAELDVAIGEWYGRTLAAQERDEPLEVTPAEYREIKLLTAAHDDRTHPFRLTPMPSPPGMGIGVEPAFSGWPIVVTPIEVH